MERLRLFVAALVPEPHLVAVDERIASFRAKLRNARWIPVANQHLTLKFLGSTPGDRLDAIARVCDMVAASHAPAELALGGLGGFPSRSRIRVLWVGVEDSAQLLGRIAADLDRAFEPLGYAPEDRPYTAHLTLARFKLPVPLREGLPDLDLADLEHFVVDRIVLFRSRLSPKGARYEPLGEFPLRGA